METINTAREDLDQADASVRGRVYFWQVAWRMALDHPVFGVGLNGYNAMYPRYNETGEFEGNRSVHSSWFGVLSETGFPGLAIFVSLIGYSLWLCARTQRLARRHPELEHLGKYANALEGAILVFCVGGSFVIFHYNELTWHLMALSIALDRIVRTRIAAVEPAVAPITRQPLHPAAAAMMPPGLLPVPAVRAAAPVRRP